VSNYVAIMEDFNPFNQQQRTVKANLTVYFKQMRAENERLQVLADDLRHGRELAESEIAGRDQQIERLQSEIAVLKQIRNSRQTRLDASRAKVATQHAKIEQLQRIVAELTEAKAKAAEQLRDQEYIVHRAEFIKRHSRTRVRTG